MSHRPLTNTSSLKITAAYECMSPEVFDRTPEKLDSQYLDLFVNVEKSSTVETGMGLRLRLVYVEYCRFL